ncbi:hypothetical protein [Pedobacter cryophilus]|uniref:Uncharacterized protein n=1 Tax=Pedobacter cryophilus TaxID=2571271 RepID=A0A4V5NXH0_9SPHI|nr:hypothetical protein [Pedobacter cryophilus]TKB99233.1 hypothetical protein FA046_09000 [Pedobacter cryophilus]
MKWGLRLFGCFDIITFLLFVKAKTLYLLTAFGEMQFYIPQKAIAIWEIIVLLSFLLSGILLFQQKKSGLIFSCIQIPFRFIYLYFSVDVFSYLAYYLGFKFEISTANFQNNWFYLLLLLEVMRYSLSAYWYNKLNQQ